MNSNEQKLIIELLLSSPDVYVRCSNIIQSDYFDPEYRGAVKFIMDYANKFKAVPDIDIVNAKFDSLSLKTKKVTTDVFKYICEEIEDFCKRSAIIKAIRESYEEIDKGEYNSVAQRVLEASRISLEMDLGINLYDNVKENLESFLKEMQGIPTDIQSLNNMVAFCRKQFTLFSANSGGGKSIMLANLAKIYSVYQKLDVLVISLELSAGMIASRLSAIATGVGAKAEEQLEKIDFIANKLEEFKSDGAGSLIIKRLPNGTSANDIRSYLKQYEIKYGKGPDVIIVDYLDLMKPNGGVKNMSVSEQDKAKSEELYEIAVDYDCLLFSASQQNREALRMSTPDQGVIAGGLTKVNAVDNYISIYMSPEMRLEGFMVLYFLKTRSASAVGQNLVLSFNSKNLQIKDLDDNRRDRAKYLLEEKISKFNSDKDKFKRNKKDKEKEEAYEPSIPVIEGSLYEEESEHNDIIDFMNENMG